MNREMLRKENALAAPLPLVKDWARYGRVVRGSLGVTCPLDLFAWLQGELQYFLPHEILIAAWGDFAAGEIRYDVVSLPQVETSPTTSSDMAALLRQLHERWITYRRSPFGINVSGLPSVPELNENEKTPSYVLHGMRSTLVHGVHDERGQQDCLYVTMHSDQEISPDSRKNLEILLPYIDTALRRVSPLPRQYTKKSGQVAASPPVCIGTLSARESEILDWVRKGKTNQEIGLILSISAYTVKNHLQRIFRKLDVYNRAQAVGKLAAVTSAQHQNYSHG